MHEAPGGTRLGLDVVTPFAARPLRRFLAAHAVPGLDVMDAATGWWTRRVDTEHGPAIVAVRLPDRDVPDDRPLTLPAVARAADPAAIEPAVETVRGFLRLCDSTPAVDEALAGDPELGAIVRERPGLRIPGTIDPAETAMFVVLGQQVSLAAARTLQARLVQWAAPIMGDGPVDGYLASPDPGTVADAHPAELRDALRMPGQRVRALQALAEALADGLDLGPDADVAGAREALLDLPGIGPWTVEYTAMRTLRDPDAFPASDLVLLNALGRPTAREAERRAEAWRPHRSRATMHLWASTAYA